MQAASRFKQSLEGTMPCNWQSMSHDGYVLNRRTACNILALASYSRF